MRAAIPYGDARRRPDRERSRPELDELLPEVLDGRLQPGKVFDGTVDLDGVSAGYLAVAERQSLKVLVQP